MMTDYDKLKGLINQGEKLGECAITSSDPDFQSWKMSVARFLFSYYGKDSLEYNSFNMTNFNSIVFDYDSNLKACKKGIDKTVAILRTYLDEMNDITQVKQNKQIQDHSRIFIVHGHDGELKQSVARLIEQQGIEAIILSEQANQGRTIIEKFEDYSDVGGAICLFTADDTGKANSAEKYCLRARQNVVFEAGYFIGKLGRHHVVLIADRDVEMPSDLSGVVYTEKGNWQFELIKELRAIGYNVDANKLI